MDWLTLVPLTLAVYRVATDLALMAGPFGAFEKWRGGIQEKYGQDHWLSDGVTCPICLSFWLALPVAFLYGPIYWLAIAGAVAFLTRVTPNDSA